MRVLQRWPANRVEVFEEGRYFRVLPTDDGPRLIIAEDAGTADQPLLRVSVAGKALTVAQLESLGATVSWVLGLDVDVSPFHEAARKEPRIAMVAAALRGMKPPRFPTLFEAVVNSVLFQQISLAAGVALAGRLAERFGPAVVWQGQTYWGAAEPERVAAAGRDELRAMGLSLRKADVLRHLAEMILSGSLSGEALARLPSEEAVRTLDELPGIGRWTAEVILLRGLGRLDVFPSGDVGARRGLARLLGREEPVTALEEREILAPFSAQRGCLYFLSLGWRLLRLGLIKPAGG